MKLRFLGFISRTRRRSRRCPAGQGLPLWCEFRTVSPISATLTSLNEFSTFTLTCLQNCGIRHNYCRPPNVSTRQIVTSVSCFIWQRDIFRVPLSTLQKKKEEGGWGLIDVEAKCKALLLYRMWTQSLRERDITAEWLRYWDLQEQGANPPHVQGIPRQLEYLRTYAREMAYVEVPKQGEAPRAFRKKMYGTSRTIRLAADPLRNVHITILYPQTDWERVWSNLHATWAADAIKVSWFKVIHDILPTKERLHAIRLTDPGPLPHVW